MRLTHVALWTRDLDAAAAFWRRTFGAEVGDLYESRNRPGFRSRFVTLPGGGDIELMAGPWVEAAPPAERVGWDHIAISLGDEAAVDALAARTHRQELPLTRRNDSDQLDVSRRTARATTPVTLRRNGAPRELLDELASQHTTTRSAIVVAALTAATTNSGD